MSDEEPKGTKPPAEPPSDPPEQNNNTGGDAVPTTWEDIFKHKRFKELNTRAQQAEQQAEEMQKLLKAKEDEGKTEIEKLVERIGALESDLESKEKDNLRLSVAQAKGIPANLVDRLQGSTRDELEHDAEALKEFLKPAEGKGNPPVPRGGSPVGFDLSNKSPDEIRQAYKEGKISFQ